MLRFCKHLAVLIVSIAASAQNANALMILNVDQPAIFPFISQPLPAGFDGVAGQTMSVVTPFGAPAIVDCTILVGACTQSTGGIASSSSTPIPGTQLSVELTASAGGDTVSADVRETCTSSCVTNITTQPTVTDYQHLMLTLEGPGVPEFIDVDVMFTLASSFVDNSTVDPTSPYATSAISALFVGEASTYNAPPVGPASIFAALDAQVIAGRDTSGNVTANESLVDFTQTIHLRPNADYWVGMIARSVTFFFQFGGPGTPHDYSGLDLSFSAFADPTFTLNAAWAAANPDLAGNVTINRQFNGMPVAVPEPRTALLLLTSLALLILYRVRSRDARHRHGRAESNDAYALA